MAGFDYSNKQDDHDAQIFAGHPAWIIFLQQYFPATEDERPEYLTTMQVLDRLNSMVDDSTLTEADLFSSMQRAGFKPLTPAPAGLFLWMIKSTPLKMIAGPLTEEVGVRTLPEDGEDKEPPGS